MIWIHRIFMRILAMHHRVSIISPFAFVKELWFVWFVLIKTIYITSFPLGQRSSTSSNCPPPLPQKPKPSVYSHLSNDTSGTYVQPQLILPSAYHRQQQPSPTRINSPIRNIDIGPVPPQLKLPYNTKPTPTVLNSHEHQQPTAYLSQLVHFIHNTQQQKS